MAGWSLENIRPKLDVIFGAEGLRYKIQHPNALSPRVFIQHESDLSDAARGIVTDIFPEGTYVDFIPNVMFPETESVSLVRKPRLRRTGRSFEKLATTPQVRRGSARFPKRKRIRISA